MARRSLIRLELPHELLTGYAKREIRLSDIAARYGISTIIAAREVRRNAQEQGVSLPRKGGHRIRLQLPRSLLLQYSSGQINLADIAKLHGVASSTAWREVRDACAEHRLAMRPRGGKRKVITLPPRLIERFIAGEISLGQLASTVGVAQNTAFRLLQDAGVEIASREHRSWRADRSQTLRELDGMVPDPPGLRLGPEDIARQIALMRTEMQPLLRRPRRRLPPGLSEHSKATMLRVFALRLRCCRLAAGLQLHELAASCGVNERTLRRLERGCHIPKRETFNKLMRRLGQPHS